MLLLILLKAELLILQWLIMDYSTAHPAILDCTVTKLQISVFRVVTLPPAGGKLHLHLLGVAESQMDLKLHIQLDQLRPFLCERSCPSASSLMPQGYSLNSLKTVETMFS